MLILTRRIGESVHIGDQVKVKVLTVRGNQVRLGIEAPREIKVNREEVVNPRVKEQRNAPAQQPASSEATTSDAIAAEERVKDGQGQ